MSNQIYKLKHVPSGLYYQPHKSGGSNLSKRGKVYQTGAHGLSAALKYAQRHPDKPEAQLFEIFVDQDGVIYKQFGNLFTWEQARYGYHQLKAYTKLTDWIVEPIGVAQPKVDYCDCDVKWEMYDMQGHKCAACGKFINPNWERK
jgi:hypothetical protein